MKKIVLLCLSVLLLFTQTAAASSVSEKQAYKLVSLTCDRLEANALHPAGIRIEIGLSSEKVNYRIFQDEKKTSQLFIAFDNSQIKNLKRHVKLNDGLIKAVHLKKEKKKSLVCIEAGKPLHDDVYDVFLLPSDKAAKQPARLVIDLYESSKESYAPGLVGRTIVLDAGHGGSDPGAVGPNGTKEKDVALAVTHKLAQRLKKAGADVVLTRMTDVDVYAPHASGVQELQARVNVAERNHAAAFVSIHANSFTSPAAHGTSTYYYTGSVRGRQLAEALQNGMMKRIDLADRGLEGAQFYVLKRTSMPSALVELAFISNYNEERLLASETFQDKLAAGLFDGLAAYFK